MIRWRDRGGHCGERSCGRNCPSSLVAGIRRLLPDQTLTEEFVDCVVRGQGEITLLELVERIWREAGL